MLEMAILPFKRYFDFKGRSRRMEYWSFFLLNMVVFAILLGLVLASGASLNALTQPGADPAAGLGMLFGGVGIVMVIYWLAVLIPSIAVVIRRLHDRDMSGWWFVGYIVASMIPIVNFIAGIAMLVLMLLPGTPGPNRFGPDPKDPAGAEVFT